jgi:hypothetical protein
MALVNAVALIHLLGCAPPVCTEDPPGAFYQLAPDQRSAAYVDAETFANVFSWLQQADDRDVSFSCLVDRFTNAFDNDVDMLVLVLHLGGQEFLERSSTRIIANFTAAQRVFESGIGDVPKPVVAPVGPSTMRSYSVIGAREGLLAGPLLHELAHGWSAYLTGPDALTSQIRRTPTSHWGFSSVGGVLGGWAPDSLEQLDDGLFRACSPTEVEPFSPSGYASNTVPFAPLELYLMGLIAAEEVPDIQIAVNPQLAGPVSTCASFTADEIVSVSIADIVGENGARSPGPADAQRHFDLGLVILAETTLSAGDWQYYQQVVSCLESTEACEIEVQALGAANSTPFYPLTFHDATGGRATLRFVELDPIAPPLGPASLPE